MYFQASEHEELPVTAMADYPKLAAAYGVWQQAGAAQGRLPAALDPSALPRDLLPYVMLLDLDEGTNGVLLRIRLAGTEVCAKHGREMKGLTTDDFFQKEDAETVIRAALKCAADGKASLAKRRYITLGDRHWSYTRLILPLSREGSKVDSFFKVADPASMKYAR